MKNSADQFRDVLAQIQDMCLANVPKFARGSVKRWPDEVVIQLAEDLAAAARTSALETIEQTVWVA